MDTASCGVKCAMIERAERRRLLVDQGKFEVRSLQLVCPLDELDDVIADAKPTPELHKVLAAADLGAKPKARLLVTPPRTLEPPVQ